MSFLDLYDRLSANTDENETDVQPCVSKIPHSEFHLWLLLPATVLLMTMSFTIHRRNKLLNCFNGRPGAVFPMDILGRSNRFSYLAAWGSIAYLAAEMVTESKFALTLEGKYVTVFNAVLSMLIYGIDYLPLFAALALESVVGYLVGTLYAWMFFGINVYKEVECDFQTWQARVILLLRDLPNLLCLGYLSVSLPVRLIQSLYRKSIYYVTASEMVAILNMEKELDSTPEAVHVKKLLRRPKPEPEPAPNIGAKIIGIVRGIIHDWIYHKKKDFRYSARMLSVMFVGALLLYKITLESLVFVLSLLQVVEYGFDLTLEGIGYVAELGESEEITTLREITYTLYYIVSSGKICFIVSVSIACAFGFLTILHMLSMYRTNLYALYRGENSFIRHRDTRSNPSLLVGSMRYAGYQVGYIGWGFVIQFIILFIVSFALAVVITLIKEGYYQWLLTILDNAWPGVLMTIFILITQFLLAKIAFLQGNDLAIDNRRFLFTVTFFFFFYNIFIGLLSCLLRIIKSIAIGTMFMSRLDHSALSRRFEMMDPGFAAYVGFIQIEATHTHPVLLMFIRYSMLDQLKSDSGSNPEDSTAIQMENSEKKPVPKPHSNKIARNRWFLMYTLYHNPSLRAYRKQYMLFLREMRRRLAQRYNLSESVLGDLVTGVTSVMDGGDINVSEDGEISMAPNMMNMNAMVAMSRFMLALQRDVRNDSNSTEKDPNGPKVDLGNVFGFQNQTTAPEENVAPSKGLWRRAAGKAYVKSQVDKQNSVRGSSQQQSENGSSEKANFNGSIPEDMHHISPGHDNMGCEDISTDL